MTTEILNKPIVHPGICTVITGITLNRPSLVEGQDEHWIIPLEVVGAYFDSDKEEYLKAYVSVHAHLPQRDYDWIGDIAPGTWPQFLVERSIPANPTRLRASVRLLVRRIDAQAPPYPLPCDHAQLGSRVSWPIFLSLSPLDGCPTTMLASVALMRTPQMSPRPSLPRTCPPPTSATSSCGYFCLSMSLSWRLCNDVCVQTGKIRKGSDIRPHRPAGRRFRRPEPYQTRPRLRCRLQGTRRKWSAGSSALMGRPPRQDRGAELTGPAGPCGTMLPRLPSGLMAPPMRAYVCASLTTGRPRSAHRW
jgi:hypothetical protein